ncbi:MAG: hypothetical protein JO323_21230 [Acidobacteriia bacterium]|nr:hypothetical protein [Terriglobia bacterium]
MIDVPKGFMIWVHLFSVVLLIGGALYGRMVLRTTSEVLAPDSAQTVGDAVAARFRGRVILAILLLLISGIFNYLHTGSHTTRYNILLGVKLLLVLHIFAAALLAARPNNPRRARQLAGIGLSGLIVILISAFLSQIA